MLCNKRDWEWVYVPDDELLSDDGGPDSLLEDILIILPLVVPEDIVDDETPEDEPEEDKESPERTEDDDAIEDDDISDLLPLEDDPVWTVVFKPPIPVRCCRGIMVAEEEYSCVWNR